MSAEHSTVIWEGEESPGKKIRFTLDTFKASGGKFIVSTLWRWDLESNGFYITKLCDEGYQFRLRSTPCSRATQKLLAQEHELAMPAAKATVALQLKRIADQVTA
jgi:hypothetical protein